MTVSLHVSVKRGELIAGHITQELSKRSPVTVMALAFPTVLSV